VLELAEVKGDVIKGKLNAGAGAEEAGDDADVTLKIKTIVYFRSKLNT
jgi:hypothetical protein